MQLICKNNAYLTALTSILVQGFNDKILNYTIPVSMDDNHEEPHTIWEILMVMDCISRSTNTLAGIAQSTVSVFFPPVSNGHFLGKY